MARRRMIIAVLTMYILSPCSTHNNTVVLNTLAYFSSVKICWDGNGAEIAECERWYQ